MNYLASGNVGTAWNNQAVEKNSLSIVLLSISKPLSAQTKPEYKCNRSRQRPLIHKILHN